MTIPFNSPDPEKDQSRLGTSTPYQSDLAHYRADTDVSQVALHHTLGSNNAQAAPGDHIHDGATSLKMGLYQMDNATGAITPSLVLTGAKGGNVALTNLIALLKNFIDFTDSTT